MHEKSRGKFFEALSEAMCKFAGTEDGMCCNPAFLTKENAEAALKKADLQSEDWEVQGMLVSIVLNCTSKIDTPLKLASQQAQHEKAFEAWTQPPNWRPGYVRPKAA